jgi:hypothetical protein
VVAFDKDERRLERLKENAQRASADGIISARLADFLTLDPSSEEAAHVGGAASVGREGADPLIPSPSPSLSLSPPPAPSFLSHRHTSFSHTSSLSPTITQRLWHRHTHSLFTHILSLSHPSSLSHHQVKGVILDPSCSGSGTVFTRMDHLLPSFLEAREEHGGADEAARVEQLARFQVRPLAV